MLYNALSEKAAKSKLWTIIIGVFMGRMVLAPVMANVRANRTVKESEVRKNVI